MTEALHAHLVYLLLWASLSLAAGLAFCRRPFGLMTAAWGAVDAAFALAGLRGGPPGPEFRSFLAFNLGLDLGYVGVGLAMAFLAAGRPRVKGFGWAIFVQGAALLALDLWLWLRL